MLKIRKSKKANNTMDKSKKYKQRSTKHTYKTKDLVTRTSLKTNNTMDKRQSTKNDLQNIHIKLKIE
jgi:hypothetical protein